MEKTIDPALLCKFVIQNYKDPKKVATVEPLRIEANLKETDFENIRKICNQALVYDFLFKEKLAGKLYPIEKAREFYSWANTGWVEAKHFVFIIREKDKKIVGAIDIKSNNPFEAEVGYWADINHPGYMTSALKGLIDKARKAGYKSLISFTRPDNARSQSVLLRGGFKPMGRFEKEPAKFLDKFVIEL